MPNDLAFAPTAQAQNFISTRFQPEETAGSQQVGAADYVEDDRYDDGLVHGHAWAASDFRK